AVAPQRVLRRVALGEATRIGPRRVLEAAIGRVGLVHLIGVQEEELRAFALARAQAFELGQPALVVRALVPARAVERVEAVREAEGRGQDPAVGARERRVAGGSEARGDRLVLARERLALETH